MYNKETIQKVEALRKKLEEAQYRVPATEKFILTAEHIALIGPPLLQTPRPVMVNGQKLLNSYTRIVCGAHGPYVEFSESQCLLPLEITKGQEWRASGKYNVKYLWKNPIDMPNVKIYEQLGKVNYADYQPHMYYIDFYTCEFLEE